MKKAYVLVGVPGVGKSTDVQKRFMHQNPKILSTDNHIEAYAEKQGKTYNDVFSEYIKTAQQLFDKDLRDAIDSGHECVVHDQTNLTAKSRSKVLTALLAAGYDVEAIVYLIPPDHEKRLNSRPGKTIPNHVLDSMIKTFNNDDNLPTLEEGFSKITFLMEI